MMQIEPSKKGGEIISGLIAHVINNFKFNEEKSKFFFNRKGKILEMENLRKHNWKVIKN